MKQFLASHLAALILVTLLPGCTKMPDTPLDEEDAELVALLDEADECQATGDHEKCFRLYEQLAAEYEKKNLTALQNQTIESYLNQYIV